MRPFLPGPRPPGATLSQSALRPPLSPSRQDQQAYSEIQTDTLKSAYSLSPSRIFKLGKSNQLAFPHTSAAQHIPKSYGRPPPHGSYSKPVHTAQTTARSFYLPKQAPTEAYVTQAKASPLQATNLSTNVAQLQPLPARVPYRSANTGPLRPHSMYKPTQTHRQEIPLSPCGPPVLRHTHFEVPARSQAQHAPLTATQLPPQPRFFAPSSKTFWRSSPQRPPLKAQEGSMSQLRSQTSVVAFRKPPVYMSQVISKNGKTAIVAHVLPPPPTLPAVEPPILVSSPSTSSASSKKTTSRDVTAQAENEDELIVLTRSSSSDSSRDSTPRSSRSKDKPESVQQHGDDGKQVESPGTMLLRLNSAVKVLQDKAARPLVQPDPVLTALTPFSYFDQDYACADMPIWSSVHRRAFFPPCCQRADHCLMLRAMERKWAQRRLLSPDMQFSPAELKEYAVEDSLMPPRPVDMQFHNNRGTASCLRFVAKALFQDAFLVNQWFASTQRAIAAQSRDINVMHQEIQDLRADVLNLLGRSKSAV